ncbi:DUF2526 family protein [Providencia manganoxydans]|uniref:DUF2526 family protein n=2 Tax=Providencia TaxID=586 RepID=A0AAI9GH32_PROST|nr:MULTISPECIES: DUF2526 family protein [Providencia]MDV5225931.1 DUF2526 family protein [Providencia rettgeri]ELR5041159.1 DUF2526 family protein [Providencia stuartii]ELR5081454.1 DUF2526 family protein [Providencia stuartii]ELR5111745.1 DUF2526 family protein [Providencia stuartii]MDX4947942.1 DUF2526 family protein [Providencia manganoxydans]
MQHYEDIVKQVDSLLTENSIVNMNILLAQLSHDELLTQEQRFELQQRLRNAIFKHHEL